MNENDTRTPPKKANKKPTKRPTRAKEKAKEKRQRIFTELELR